MTLFKFEVTVTVAAPLSIAVTYTTDELCRPSVELTITLTAYVSPSIIFVIRIVGLYILDEFENMKSQLSP